MINQLKIFQSDSYDPYYNLAVEKHLFDIVEKGCVILYLWQNDNTIVIGANQNPWAECNHELAKSENVKIARRISGGGAVYHDLGNLNFTFISHTEDYNLGKNLEVIKKAVELAGISSEISGRNDILYEGKKFSGNAFYNSNSKSYHHGTLLINTDFDKMKRYLTPSKTKLEAKGVKSVSSRVINLTEINNKLTISKMKEHFISAAELIFNLKSTEISYTDEKEILAISSKYSGWDYIYKKTAPFDIFLSSRFDFGEITLNLSVKNAIIEGAEVFTDSMDFSLAEKIKGAIIGAPFEKQGAFIYLSRVLGEKLSKDISSLIK